MSRERIILRDRGGKAGSACAGAMI